MAANGKVCTGFSSPWVAIYGNTGTTVTYSSAAVLARGVSVAISPDDVNNDNIFSVFLEGPYVVRADISSSSAN